MDEEEIAGRGEGFFRFVALLAPRALLERPTLNPSLIRDQFRLIASVFSIKPILIWAAACIRDLRRERTCPI